jgi:hypothetical protein
MLIDAAGNKVEKRRLIQWRYDRNTESLTVARAMEKKVSAFVTYAKGLIGSPRGITGKGMPRLHADFARLEALSKEVEAQLAVLPEGSVGLRSLVYEVRSCIDCSDDRRLCKDMVEELGTFRENIAEMQKLVTADLARLKQLPK